MVCMSMRSTLFPFALLIAFALSPYSHGLGQSSTTSASTLNYHGGPLLSTQGSINIYLVLYGTFPAQDTAPIHDFFASLSSSSAGHQTPTVSTWWTTILAYKDKAGKPVSGILRVAGFHEDKTCSLGKNIKRLQIANYVKKLIETKLFPLDSNGVYLFLTAKDVAVERFCSSSCGFHDHMVVSPNGRVVYAHVGDPGMQCPGLCAWPYAVPAYGPPGNPLVSPNGVGIDGMIMNIATVLAGAATNPFKTGYFQGNALAPLEAVTACPGIFGPGAYPGYPGKLMVDRFNKASYNAYGANGKKFLLPAIWDLNGSTCKFLA